MIFFGILEIFRNYLFNMSKFKKITREGFYLFLNVENPRSFLLHASPPFM